MREGNARREGNDRREANIYYLYSKKLFNFNLSKTSPKSFKNLSKTFPKSFKNLLRIFKRAAKNYYTCLNA